MRQHITREQINELSFESKEKLFKSLFPQLVEEERIDGSKWKVYDINNEYLTIGRMIEFLGDEWIDGLFYDKQYEKQLREIMVEDDVCFIPNNKNLCDYLWKAVKEVLEK